jgi:hypothetical protein
MATKFSSTRVTDAQLLFQKREISIIVYGR